MKKMSRADIERKATGGAKVRRQAPKAPEKPQVDTKKLEADLKAVRAKLEAFATKPETAGKKKNFEFTVERDGQGFIQKIHAKEL